MSGTFDPALLDLEVAIAKKSSFFHRNEYVNALMYLTRYLCLRTAQFGVLWGFKMLARLTKKVR
jgi:hypothetical protein